IDRNHAGTAAPRKAVVLERCAFADAVFAGDEQTGGWIADFNRLEEIVVVLETHPGNAGRGPAHGAKTLRAGVGLRFDGPVCDGSGRVDRFFDSVRSLLKPDRLSAM